MLYANLYDDKQTTAQNMQVDQFIEVNNQIISDRPNNKKRITGG